jgi:hypothetical protein
MSPVGRGVIQPSEVHSAVCESSSRYQPDWSSRPGASCGIAAEQVAPDWPLAQDGDAEYEPLTES